MTYRGRFAPSPTGPLHFGSLAAAVASYLDARAQQGVWLVRMEDVDLPRSVAGADRLILETLEAFGFRWDEPVLYQSARTEAYCAALDRLRQGGWAYPCSCSRKETGARAYPGTCREGPKHPRRPLCWRVRFGDPALGDFVVQRADGFFSYQLAVVVDDAAQRITHVVRGADLLDSTPWQNWLQKLLEYPVPQYRHIPIATNAAGEKLSKLRDGAVFGSILGYISGLIIWCAFVIHDRTTGLMNRLGTGWFVGSLSGMIIGVVRSPVVWPLRPLKYLN